MKGMVPDRIIRFLQTYKYTLCTIIALFVCLLYYYIDPLKYRIAPKCPIKLLTNLDCPSCGFQRALHATLHGNIIEAVHYNLFLVIAIPMVLLWFLNSLIIEYTSQQQRRLSLIKWNRILIYIYIAAYLCWFVIRNIN